jgi:hypothetical protein
MTCRSCALLDVPRDAGGRRRPIQGQFYHCRATAPDLKAMLPASVFRRVASIAHEVALHSGNAMMKPDWGEGCAFWKALRKEGRT